MPPENKKAICFKYESNERQSYVEGTIRNLKKEALVKSVDENIVKRKKEKKAN